MTVPGAKLGGIRLRIRACPPVVVAAGRRPAGTDPQNLQHATHRMSPGLAIDPGVFTELSDSLLQSHRHLCCLAAGCGEACSQLQRSSCLGDVLTLRGHRDFPFLERWLADPTISLCRIFHDSNSADRCVHQEGTFHRRKEKTEVTWCCREGGSCE